MMIVDLSKFELVDDMTDPNLFAPEEQYTVYSLIGTLRVGEYDVNVDLEMINATDFEIHIKFGSYKDAMCNKDYFTFDLKKALAEGIILGDFELSLSSSDLIAITYNCS